MRILKSLAFISYTNSGLELSTSIKDHIIRPDLEMESFLSDKTIRSGQDILEKILEFLTKTDILIIIIESGVIGSKWVKWEYKFSKDRGIKIIPVIFKQFIPKVGKKCPWYNIDDKYIEFDGNCGNVNNTIYNEIDDMRTKLENLSLKRNAIQLQVKLDKTQYVEKGEVKICGTVRGALTGKVYVHIPNTKNDPPIVTEEINDSIMPQVRSFESTFELPSSPSPINTKQIWFIEIKFDGKSEIIPIEITKNESASNKTSTDVHTSSINQSGDIQKIKEKMDNVSKGTSKSIPQTIKDQTINRDAKISKIIDILDGNDRVVVTGNKGSGKSVFLCQLYEKLAEQNTILFLRCDDYLNIESIEQLNNSVILEHNLMELIRQIATRSEKLIIIFDSLDAISRNEKSMNIFKQFLKNIWGIDKVKTICSVRSYDYEYSPSINKTNWGIKYDLKLLTTDETDEMLKKLGNPTVSYELRKILNNPLHLKLISLILERSPNADFTNITNEIELYDEHWNEYIEKSEFPNRLQEKLYDIAHEMSISQRISISKTKYDDSSMQKILSKNLILHDTKNNSISFFHHAYLDYVLSRFILEKHSEFIDFLQTDEYNIFLRPTIVFTLSVLHKRNPKEFIRIIKKILDSNLKYFWKISSLTALAKIKKLNDQNYSELGKIFTKENSFQKHFLMEITRQKNYFWFDLWKNSLFIEWSSVDNGNSIFIAEYIKYINQYTDDHESIFKIIQLIIENANNNWAKRIVVETLSEINIKEKAEWLYKLSKNENIDIRNGMVESLLKLIKTNPEIIPDIFSNLFTYVEDSMEQTQLASYGTLGFTSTKKQDNSMIVWNITELFPKLLKNNPIIMIKSIFKIFEILRKKELTEYEGDVIEDYGYIWLENRAGLRDEDKLINYLTKYLHGCDDKKIEELIPLFKSTRLATFHAMLIDVLILRKNDGFITHIFNKISNPQIYKITTLRRSLRCAIKIICPALTKEQISKLLDNVMNIKIPKIEINQQGLTIVKKIKAGFLSEFPKDVLQSEHHDIIKEFSEQDIKYKPDVKISTKIEKNSTGTIFAEPNPEEIITNYLKKTLEYNDKIKLLVAIAEYLEKENELDSTKIQPIKEFLLKNKKDLDPQKNQIDENSNFIIEQYSIRGLVAEGLVKLLYHTKDSSLESSIKQLANDPINLVRSKISRTLEYLFEYDYDFAFTIVKKYSTENDKRVLFYLVNSLYPILDKNTKHATSIINNILNAFDRDYPKINGIENLLIYLAFHKKEPDAITLLNDIVNEHIFEPEIRSHIPFRLKENYLFDNKFQNKSLELLYKLLDDPDSNVREQATFFTLNSFKNDKLIENEEFIEKIHEHLDLIVLEVDRDEPHPRIIEEIVEFLKKYWTLLPEKTIDYLEKITNEKLRKFATYNPRIVDLALEVLNGMFENIALSKENRKRCLNILDKYAKVGWPDALKLLSAMERTEY